MFGGVCGLLQDNQGRPEVNGRSYSRVQHGEEMSKTDPNIITDELGLGDDKFQIRISTKKLVIFRNSLDRSKEVELEAQRIKNPNSDKISEMTNSVMRNHNKLCGQDVSIDRHGAGDELWWHFRRWSI